jgi:1,4-dihydroxy-2-naphthoyl-CoA hydrolase
MKPTDDRHPRATPRPSGRLPNPEELNAILNDRLPGILEFAVTAVAAGRLEAQMPITVHHLAPNGYLHAATVVALADTACGLGCRLALPEGSSYTTLELKTSFLRTARAGSIHAVASLIHGGRRTQVWDAAVSDDAGKTLALFRCTQLIL